MAKCVEKLPHSCGSSDGLQVFEEDGKYTGFCFACGTYESNPYSDKDENYKPVVKRKTEEEVQEELDDVDELSSLDLPTRKLKKEYLEYFGVKVGVSQTDGETPETVYFPYYTQYHKLQGYKVRLLDPKRMWAIGTTRDAAPFGLKQALEADGPKLFITEGEFDAIALFQLLKERNKGGQWADKNIPVISLSSGASSVVHSLSKYRPIIEKHFKEIVFVFDGDKAGKKAIEDGLKLFPDAQVVELPEKDVNDCLIKGKSKQAQAALLFKSEKPKNTRIINGRSLHEKAKKPAEWGLPWPWPGINKVTRGIRTGETIYLGAGAKMGKSEVVDQLTAHFIQAFGWRVFLVKPEQSNEETYKRVLGKVARKNFTDPEIEFDDELFDKAGEVVGDSLEILDLYQHVAWETLEKDIRDAAGSGAKAVFIDPITNLTNGMDAATANVKLQEIAQRLSALALDLDILILIFCHLRNPDSGPDHANGGKVLSSQFAGSRAMARSCNLMIGLEGNKDPDLDEESRNVRQLVVLENRTTGETGRWPLYWDKASTIFTEMK